ncbi:MAG: hypothetical protein HQL86_08280 [Magnetococcales bacterium]|nr:hypothetical protein [Magnetococcales bacterium]
MKLRRVLLLSGRHLRENPYRELVIKRRLEQLGVKVKFAVPSRGLNKSAPEEPVHDDSVLEREGAIQLDGEWDFRMAMRSCQMVVFSTWRSYLPLTRMAQSEGRLTINFCASSGLDHWAHGVERCLIRSQYIARQLRYLEQTEGHITPPDDQLRIVGSLQYEFPHDHQPPLFPNREAFCHHYDLDPARPIAVLFPKGIDSFHKKVALWFPHWDRQQVDLYNQWFLDKYAAICHQAREAHCNLLVKLHPSAYASYNCDVSSEIQYWQRYPWTRVLKVEHTMPMYRHMDVGLGINSHSALECGLFNKPFIYVDSDLQPPPDTPSFKNIRLCRLPHGPSMRWQENLVNINPWFWSWLGDFSRAETLAEKLVDPVNALPIRPEDRQAFIHEFWGVEDLNASERIVDEIIRFGEERLGFGSRWLSPSYWRGLLMDGQHWLRGRYDW